MLLGSKFILNMMSGLQTNAMSSLTMFPMSRPAGELYLVADLESDIQGDRLLQCVIDFNSSNKIMGWPIPTFLKISQNTGAAPPNTDNYYIMPER